jgi:hypothetical protein
MFTLLALCFYLVGFITYMKACTSDNATPNLASWAAWTLGASASLVVTYSLGTKSNYLYTCLLDVVICVTVLLLNLKRGLWKELSSMQKGCSALASIALILSAFNISPEISALLIAIGTVSFLPTIMTTWKGIGKEPVLSWGLWTTSLFITSIQSILAMNSYWQLVLPISSFACHFAVFIAALHQKTLTK